MRLVVSNFLLARRKSSHVIEFSFWMSCIAVPSKPVSERGRLPIENETLYSLC